MSITNYLANKLIDYNSERSLAFKLRKKRAVHLKSLIDTCYKKNGKVNLIDVGGTKTYWNIITKEFLVSRNVHITVVNLPSSTPTPENDEIFTFTEGDGCNLEEIPDQYFHISHSNSVIEHVGRWENIVKFASELERVATSFYLQTPNYWFPVEPHFITPFFHWFPKSVRIWMVMKFKLGWYNKANNYKEAEGIVDTCNLLSKKDLKKLFPNARYHSERIIFLVKSLVLIKS